MEKRPVLLVVCEFRYPIFWNGSFDWTGPIVDKLRPLDTFTKFLDVLWLVFRDCRSDSRQLRSVLAPALRDSGVVRLHESNGDLKWIFEFLTSVKIPGRDFGVNSPSRDTFRLSCVIFGSFMSLPVSLEDCTSSYS